MPVFLLIIAGLMIYGMGSGVVGMLNDGVRFLVIVKDNKGKVVTKVPIKDEFRLTMFKENWEKDPVVKGNFTYKVKKVRSKK